MGTRPASSEQQTADTSLPLSGITVADFSWVIAGPRTTSWLGAMGARVIKIEGPRRPDQYRYIRIFEEATEGHLDGSGGFHAMNYSKLGVAIDFRHPRGLELAREIVARADIVAENFSAGVMDRVGLGYEELRKIRPDVIFVSISGLGQTGPDREHLAYGQLIHAVSGYDSLLGYEGESGRMSGTYADPVAATTATLAILAALWHRERTGQGQAIDVSMQESMLMQVPEHVLDYTANGRVAASHGNDRPIAAPHDTFPCLGEDSWVAIGVEDQAQWEAFARAIGSPPWTSEGRFRDQPSRYAHRAELYDLVAAWTRTRTAQDAADALQAAGVAAGPVLNARGVCEHPHLRERGMIVELEHPVVGRKPVVGLPYVLEPGPSEHYWPAPTFGQHTSYVLEELLGLDAAEVEALRAEGVVA